MFWKLTLGFLPFFYFIVNMLVFVALQCCCKKKKVKKVLKRREMSANEKQKVEVKKGNKKKKKNGPSGKAQKPSTLTKSKENNKDEKEMPTAISSEHQSNKEDPLKSKTKTKTGVFTGSIDTSTPTALTPMIGEIGGEKKVSAVLTAFAEKEKKEAEKKFPMEEDIDDHPDYDTLQFADKKDVFKTGFTSKGVRIEKEAPQKKLRPGDSAYMDDGVV
uniref:Uncharacterized protein n=1 Tax=Meloidogyne enterolobii TaxID=390850 RepID=A0A6V7TWL9_MELEN|nr:unnamed protein product [Meloidogyne enterolobii]